MKYLEDPHSYIWCLSHLLPSSFCIFLRKLCIHHCRELEFHQPHPIWPSTLHFDPAKTSISPRPSFLHLFFKAFEPSDPQISGLLDFVQPWNAFFQSWVSLEPLRLKPKIYLDGTICLEKMNDLRAKFLSLIWPNPKPPLTFGMQTSLNWQNDHSFHSPFQKIIPLIFLQNLNNLAEHLEQRHGTFKKVV